MGNIGLETGWTSVHPNLAYFGDTMKDPKLIIAIGSCVVMISSLLIGCGVLIASVNNSTEALKEVKVVIEHHNTRMSALENRVNLNELDDTHTKEKVSELQDAVKLLAILNGNIEKLLQRDG